MNIDRAVMAFAGIVVLVSVLLAWQVSPAWLLLTGFVGLKFTTSSVHRFLSIGQDFGEVRTQARPRIQITNKSSQSRSNAWRYNKVVVSHKAISLVGS